MDDGLEQNDLRKLDQCFPHFDEAGKFEISHKIPNYVEFNDRVISIPRVIIVSDLLKKYGYANTSTDSSLYGPVFCAELTQKGREAKAAGGHFAYLKKNSEKELLEGEISKYDFLQKKFIYKARYLPYIISLGALIVSLFAYFKPFNKKSEENSPETKIHDTLQFDLKNKIIPKKDTAI